MYHDEFAKQPAKPNLKGEPLLPGRALEVGGGLSLGLAASLNQPLAMTLYYLGGLLPLVACSLSIAGQWLASLAAKPQAIRLLAVPVPHWPASRGRGVGHQLGRSRARATR